jgi:tRNA (Thr-GGU) A37 N-methylase
VDIGYLLKAHSIAAVPATGVFGTMTVMTFVELLGRTATGLRVRGIDMLDGTPVLDVKPYLSSVPADRLTRGWLDEAEARRSSSEGRGY